MSNKRNDTEGFGRSAALMRRKEMVMDAPIIILDEATANVDPENEKELTEAIGNLTRKKTIIMIAHRLKTVPNADQIVVIDKGRIVQKGRHGELWHLPGFHYRQKTGGQLETVVDRTNLLHLSFYGRLAWHFSNRLSVRQESRRASSDG